MKSRKLAYWSKIIMYYVCVHICSFTCWFLDLETSFQIMNEVSWVVFLFAKFSFWGNRRWAAWYPVGGLLYMHGSIVSWCDWMQQYCDTKIMMLSWPKIHWAKQGRKHWMMSFQSGQKTAPRKPRCFPTDLVLIDLSLEYLSCNYRACWRYYCSVSTACVIILCQL